MIKFNLLRPDDDFPEDVLEREEAEVEEEIEDPPLEEEEGTDEESGETLDETVLDELDEYKNIPGEEKVIPLEEEKIKKTEKKEKVKRSSSLSLIILSSAAVLLFAFWATYYLGMLPPGITKSIDDLKDNAVLLVSGEKIPEPAISEERLYEEKESAATDKENREIADMRQDERIQTEVVSKQVSDVADRKIEDNKIDTKRDTERITEGDLERDNVIPENTKTDRIADSNIDNSRENNDISRVIEPEAIKSVKTDPVISKRSSGEVALSDSDRLTMASAQSMALIDHNSSFISLFPKGLFISTMSTSASDLVLEAKASDQVVFKEFKDKIDNSALFNSFLYIPDSAPNQGKAQAIFRGKFQLRANNQDTELYNFSSERFIKAVADIANQEKMTFTEMRSFNVENDFENIKTTMHQIGFYGNIEKINNFMAALKELPATYSLEKIYLSRKATDSFPIPIKMLLYVSVQERDE